MAAMPWWEDGDETGVFKLKDIPPHSLEAEMCALGSAMITRAATEELLTTISDEALIYHPAHQEIYRAIKAVYGEGKAVDLVTLKNKLVETERLPHAGGIEYLINLNEVVPTAINAAHYCRIVCDYAVLRRLQSAGKSIVDIVNDPELDVHEKVEKARGLVEASSYSRGQGVTASQINLDAERTVVPWQLGLIGAEQMDIVGKLGETTNGLYTTQVTTVEADTGIGKSWAAQQTIVNCCRMGYRVRLIQLADMTETDVANRIIGMMCGVPSKPKLTPSSTESDKQAAKRWAEAETEFRSWGDLFEIYDSSAEGNSETVQEIGAWVRRRHRELPAQVVVWDYVQMLRWQGRTQGLTEELNLCSRELDVLAKSLKSCATVVLSQVNGEGQTQYSTQPEKIAAVRVQITDETEGEQKGKLLKWTIKKHRFKPVKGWSGFWERDYRGQFFDVRRASQ